MTDTLTWQILEISLFQRQMTGKIAEENLMSIKTMPAVQAYFGRAKARL